MSPGFFVQEIAALYEKLVVAAVAHEPVSQVGVKEGIAVGGGLQHRDVIILSYTRIASIPASHRLSA